MRDCAAHPRVRCALRVGIEVDHLAGCVHPGVGTPRDRYPDRGVGDAGERPFHTSLDAARPGLQLPAAEGRAVVLEDGGDTHAGIVMAGAHRALELAAWGLEKGPP